MMLQRDDRLVQHILAIEAIDAEIEALREARRDRFALLKAEGYCPRTSRAAIARRKLDPARRVEVDLLLETYERALNGEPVDIPDARPDLRELAIAILAEQIEGIEDPAKAERLAEHLTVVLDIRAERRELLEAQNARVGLAVEEGFVKKPFMALVQWIEKCAKHGAENLRAGEALFQLYRGTVEARGLGAGAPVTGDPKLKVLTKAPAARPVVAKLAWHDAGDR